MNRLLSIALACFATALVPLQASAQLTAVPLGSSAAPYGYYEYLPFGYDDNLTQEWPVVIFLHGLGKKGNGTTELYKVLEEAMPEEIKTGRTIRSSRFHLRLPDLGTARAPSMPWSSSSRVPTGSIRIASI
jgi:hypothetical protein